MATVFEKTKMLTDAPLHYCPGCTHGIVHRLVAECIEELGMEAQAIGVAPVGCSVYAYNYFNCDMMEAAHGRAPAVATGIKRVHPDKLVFTYNYKNGSQTVSLADIFAAFGSDSRAGASPDENRTVQPKTVVQCGFLCI